MWANQVAEDFPEYSVTFHGAGFWEATRESHGPASQVVVFTKKELAARRRGDDHHQPVQAPSTESGWEVVEKIEYPVAREETRSREEQLGDELCFHLRGILWEAAATVVEEEEVGAPLSSLLQFESVAGMKTNVDEVTDVLQTRGFKVLDGIVFAQVLFRSLASCAVCTFRRMMAWPPESVSGGLTLLMMRKKPSVRTTEGIFRMNRVLEMSFDYFVDVQIMPICFRL